MLRLSHSEEYPLILPEGHRFPFQKYEWVRQQLEYEGVIGKQQVFSPEFVEDEVIHLTHCREYWAKARRLQLSERELRKIGFPGSETLILRSLSSASGTVRCAENALQDGAGMNLAGGTHHAFFDRGEGFSLLNDIGIAANYLLAQGWVKRILVVDLDVHQGNGTAALFAGRPEVFTFSLHCRENYPFSKESSDLDVEVAAGTKGKAYLEKLEEYIPALLEQHQPELVFYQAGVDVLAGDRLGRLQLSLHDCYERDRRVIQACASRKIPLVTVMGGGYSHKVNMIVKAHCNTLKLVIEHYEKSRYFLS